MKIAPIDIAHKSFARKMLGFDPQEVTDFLQSVADEMETLIRERNSLRETVREKERSLLEYRERDEMLKKTLATATHMSDKIREDSQKEAQLVVNDAHQKADAIVRDARDSLKKTYAEISDLKRLKVQFESNIRSAAQSHLALLDQGPGVFGHHQNQRHTEKEPDKGAQSRNLQV